MYTIWHGRFPPRQRNRRPRRKAKECAIQIAWRCLLIGFNTHRQLALPRCGYQTHSMAVRQSLFCKSSLGFQEPQRRLQHLNANMNMGYITACTMVVVNASIVIDRVHLCKKKRAVHGLQYDMISGLRAARKWVSWQSTPSLSLLMNSSSSSLLFLLFLSQHDKVRTVASTHSFDFAL